MRDIKNAALDQTITLSVAELMTLSATLQSDGIRLEPLTGPFTGVHDPTGVGSTLFAVLAVTAQLDHDHIREKTPQGQRAAAARGRHGGRPALIDPDSLTYGLALHDAGTPDPGIAKQLTIKTGKDAGRRPCVYRALAVVGDPSWTR